jgi:tungstate transport system substrate-binding protein
VGVKSQSKPPSHKKITSCFWLILLLTFLLTACSLDRNSTDTTRWLILATTQEVAESGWLDVAVPKFEQTQKVRIKRLIVNPDQALRYARDGGVDVLLLNGGKELDELAGSPPFIPPFSDKPVPTTTLPPVPTVTPTPQAVKFLLSERTLVFWTQLVLIGPANEPCGGNSASTALKIMQRITEDNSRCKMLVAGKESGLRSVEENLWKLVGLPKIEDRGANYQIFNGDALTTLREAEKQNAHTIVPLSVYLNYADQNRLKILYDRDAALFSSYEAAIPNITRFRDRDLPLARSFVNYLTGTEIQNLIGDSGKAKFNRPLFRPKEFLVYIPN